MQTPEAPSTAGGAAFTTQVSCYHSLALVEGLSVLGPVLDRASGSDGRHQGREPTLRFVSIFFFFFGTGFLA